MISSHPSDDRNLPKYNRLPKAGKRLARIPRYGRLIAMLPPERFDRLTSEAAVYWETFNYVSPERNSHGVTGLFDDGLRAKAARRFGWHLEGERDWSDPSIRRWQVRLVRDLIAAIAFEMHFGRRGYLKQVDTNVDGFLNDAFDRFEQAGAYRTDRNRPIAGDYLRDDWLRLKAMNTYGLKHLVFNATDEVLKFANPSLARFFAAFWACRAALPQADRKRLMKTVPDPLTGGNEDHAEFWRFVVDVPDALELKRRIRRDSGSQYWATILSNWVQLMSPLYDIEDDLVRDEQGRKIRSTELIYRSWERMKDTDAGQKFRSERLGKRPRAKAERRALEMLEPKDFLLLGCGERGVKPTFRTSGFDLRRFS